MPRLTARELKQWLDEGRPLTLLDVRNDFEVRMGTFEGAYPSVLNTFASSPLPRRNFRSRINRTPSLLSAPAAFVARGSSFFNHKSFDQVFQLEGGILKYFEELRKRLSAAPALSSINASGLPPICASRVTGSVLSVRPC